MPSPLPRGRLARRLSPIAALAAGALLATTLPAAAATPSTSSAYIGVLINGPCVYGTDYQGGGSIKVVQKRGGTTISTADLPSTGTAWNACLKPIKVGDVLRVTETVSANAVNDRTMTVPDLTVTVNPSTNVESGHVPKGSTLVNYGVRPTIAGLKAYEITHGDTANVNGDFTYDWTALLDVHKGDVASLMWQDTTLDRWFITVAAPSVGVQVGKATIAGTGPLGGVTTTIRTATGALRGTAKGSVSGSESAFGATFRAGGKAVKVKVGDRVTSSRIAGSYKVRASDMKVKKTGPTGNGSLTATCAPGSDWATFVNGVWTGSGVTGPGGAVSSTNVSKNSGALFAGSEVKLACRLPSGFGQVFADLIK